MNLKEILSISGQPGLFKFLAQSVRGVIVESIGDGKRSNVPPTAKVSSLGEIAVFTESEEMPLSNVFQAMFRHLDGKAAPSHKSNEKDILAFFSAAIPSYDKERVHVSDMKKILSWYNILLDANAIDLKEEEEPKAE